MSISITKNIVRFFCNPQSVYLDELTVEELMDENDGFEESAHLWITEMVEQGVYNDSDPPGVICYYVCPEDKREALMEELAAWERAHPEIEVS